MTLQSARLVDFSIPQNNVGLVCLNHPIHLNSLVPPYFHPIVKLHLFPLLPGGGLVRVPLFWDVAALVFQEAPMKILGNSIMPGIVLLLGDLGAATNNVAAQFKSSGVIALGPLALPQPVPKRKAHKGACGEVQPSVDYYYFYLSALGTIQ
eukprot:1702335-Ditylum_brightwellii.AAC.1